ncbi:MAG TPA: hypothetical protein VKG25_11170 [Bryobacteraceae bacterium]|nr:hypothetical protein [Bryobacteraceae bacterium]
MRYPISALAIVLIGGILIGGAAQADELSDRAWQLESKGDAAGARELLRQAAQSGSATIGTVRDYAEFLDRHHDPATRAVYQRLLASATTPENRKPLARRLVLLDLVDGENAAAARDLQIYREANGTDFTLGPAEPKLPENMKTVTIPGPIRSFSRMAALSPDLSRSEVIGALARNIVTNGYQAANNNEALEQTEYLKLVVRYLTQAREIEKLAGATDKTIRIENCESSQTGDLLRVLGYRMRGGCGSEVVLETINASRAFLTIDSGFPLSALEQSLRANRPFVYDYHPSEVGLLYGPEYWLSAKESQTGEFIDAFIGDPALCRLYLGLSKLEPRTAEELRKTSGVQRLRAFSHVLDFYGGMFDIRNGKAVVPGGARTERTWGELVGVFPDKGGAFFERLVAKDDGWMASYYDALARLNDGPVQRYLTDPERMKRFYAAIRGKVTSPGPARPVFRANTDMLLLTARLRLDADGRPHIPGGLEVWKGLFLDHPHGKYDSKLTKSAGAWKEPDDVVEALFGLSRKSVENEPLKIFMALSDVDRHRHTPLAAATVNRLARAYRDFGSQYPIFAEVPELTDATILAFMETAESTTQIKDQELRADTIGTFQALTGLWQICYRQGAIPANQADQVLADIASRFQKVKNEREVFDEGREGVKILLAAAHPPGQAPAGQAPAGQAPSDAAPQDRMLDLLAGANGDASDAQTQVVEEMIRLFEAQRLISLTALFDLVDNLERVAKGEKANMPLVNKTAGRISEIQLPRASLSSVEKNSLSFGYWSERHIETQRKLNLRALIDKASTDPKKLEDVRGLFAPFLRDTLVGLNYVYYAPPGAQIVRTNPLFVRSHDFIGLPGTNESWRPTEVLGNGWPTSAGGRLVGSLAGLPYAIAEAEQNFLVPTREQALIWGDLVPQLLVSATVARWWHVTPSQLHWVGLHMEYAETLAAESAVNAEVRRQFIEALSAYATPARLSKLNDLLEAGQAKTVLDNLMPSEMFAVAADLAAHGTDTMLAAEIRRQAAGNPRELNYASISRAFGTPKPTLTNSYVPELLNLRTFPTLMGYSSRILAESWESNLLYYAALADQIHAPPAQLNLLVPVWTQETVERIFATHLEDWPALLRSLRLVGEDVLEKTRKQAAVAAGAGN